MSKKSKTKMAADGDGFKVVSSKKKKKSNKARKTGSQNGAKYQPNQEDEVDVETMVEKVLKIKTDFLSDPYADIVKDGLKAIQRQFPRTSKPDLISYGIGNFASCLIARYQLALLLIMRDELDSKTQCLVFDPVFTKGEKECLLKMNFEIIPTNEEGKRVVDHPTVFYMPHCGKALYNNLLWSNWSREKLENLVIIGNSFSQMLESLPSSVMKREAYYIYQIAEYCEELHLENKFHFDDIFNNTSIHLFKSDLLKNAEDSMWTDRDQPVYDSDNLEIILKR